MIAVHELDVFSCSYFKKVVLSSVCIRLQSLKTLHDRFGGQFIRFAITGVLATILHIMVATWFITKWLFLPSFANGIAFATAASFSYVMNTRWSFSSKVTVGNIARFTVVSIVGLSLSMGISGLAHLYGLHYFYGIMLVVFIVPLVTFLLHKVWTYRP